MSWFLQMMPLSSDLHALLFDVLEVWYGRECPHNQQKEMAQQFQQEMTTN